MREDTAVIRNSQEFYSKRNCYLISRSVFLNHRRRVFVCRLPVEISFTATEQKEVNFNVLCYVKKKTSPLTLNVKAEGYAMNAQLICEDSQGNKVELTSKGTNRINLGMVSRMLPICMRLFLEVCFDTTMSISTDSFKILRGSSKLFVWVNELL